jgi:uncharacterized RDD family membrane protein YckC
MTEPDRSRIELVTPEGVSVPFTIASVSDRAGALFIDVVLQAVVAVALVLVTQCAGASLSGWQAAFTFVVLFVIRSFYFVWFELRWLGRTPGKRALGVRVVDASGGPLTTDAILARNFMRELELWLPLAVLVAPQVVWPGVPGWAQAAAAAWVLLLASMPLWNRRRQRVGDLVAGTLVVVAPKTLLLREVAAVEKPARHRFSDKQLDVYGIRELQVLEDVLHRRQKGLELDVDEAFVVAEKIRKKIGWAADGKLDVDEFLADFYAALRARLEARMLLGKKRIDKHAR